jgi:hypothetical protein
LTTPYECDARATNRAGALPKRVSACILTRVRGVTVGLAEMAFLMEAHGVEVERLDGQISWSQVRQRRSQDQRKYLRDCVAPRSPAHGTQSSHRGDCPSTVSADLADPAPERPLRGARPSSHQTIAAEAHCKNDPATPKFRLPDRTTQLPTPQSNTSMVVFDPVVVDDQRLPELT